MTVKCFILLAISLFFLNCKSQNTPLYIGTGSEGESKGIYKVDFNSKTGEVSNITLAAKAKSPTFIAFAPNKKFIYAVGEGSEETGVSSFKLHSEDKLKLINSVSSNGKGPCHIAVNETGTKAVVSNYGGGTIAIYDINTDGSLNEAAQVFNHNKGDQPARAHSAQFHNNDLYVADLGNNAVYNYALDNGNYILKSDAIVDMEGNLGPRHFALTKDDRFIYVINEYGGSITSIEKTDSGFKQIDFDTTLNDNYKGKVACADIHLSKDERFLYGSNRGENTIALFSRNVEDGTIERIENVSTEGNWPRNFTLDPSGKFLLVANRRSSNISVFKIDTKIGKLSFLQSIELPNPTCLLF